MTNIIELPKRKDIEPNTILEEAKDELDSVVIIGKKKDGTMLFDYSDITDGHILWLLEKAKLVIMDAEFTEE